MIRRWLVGVLLLATAASQAAPVRIVVLGGALTEVVYALGGGTQVVGVDQSSRYPVVARSLPQVGYYRNFSAEGVITLKPDLVILSDHAGPPVAVQQLKAAGLHMLSLSSEPDRQALRERLLGVGKALERDAEARQKLDEIEQRLDLLSQQVAKDRQTKPRVLFLMARGGTPQSAGQDTIANRMIELAGGVNAISGFDGYRPLSLESVLAAKPDWIVTTTMSADAMGGVARIQALPGVALTPAAREKRILVFDDLFLLGFGPRVAEAVAELRKAWRSTPVVASSQ
ncbi:ABC transporter substrate-binding protein [Chitinivorax sp. B]|uniref:heme/hemin ABC transporter substrate-binding protein n=1 Tax=Chitinivorax sp. B TaxID=2502235 RepID=UPI0010F4A9B3|nr:ABC transporter substrate-binding protein [Chitinivorax sp. B]